jgi:hypothetical protein
VEFLNRFLTKILPIDAFLMFVRDKDYLNHTYFN